MKLIAISALILLTACGSKGGNGSSDGDEATDPQTDSGETDAATDGAEASQYAKLIADAAALPACDAEHEGALVYVKASGEFQSCASGKWAVVPMGPKILGEFKCDGKIGEDQNQFFYQITKTSDGITRIYAEFGGQSRERFYRPGDETPQLYEVNFAPPDGKPFIRMESLTQGTVYVDDGTYAYKGKDNCELTGAL